MKLRCILNEKTGSLIFHQLYKVVAVSFNLHTKDFSYIIVDEYKRLAFYEGYYFELIENLVDDDWVLNIFSNEFYIFLPKILSYDTFFEDYHNDEEVAVQNFKSRFPDLI